MRKLLLLLFVVCSFGLMAQTRVVKNPPFSTQNSQTLEIDSIELNAQSTVFHISGYSAPNDWIKIDSRTYIVVNGEKLMLESADGIELDKEEIPGESGRRVFSLTFPPIAKTVKKIDFIESDCETCFKIWGIELNSPVLTNRIPVPQIIKAQAVVKDDGKPLATPTLKPGVAVIKGYLLGYRPEMQSKVSMYYNNPLSGDQDEYETKVADNGSFELKVPLLSTAQVLLRVSSPWYNKYILLTPDKETVFYFDLQQLAQNESRTRVDKAQSVRNIYFGGANAEINNQVESENMDYTKYSRQFIDYEKILADCGDMSGNEFKKYLMDQYRVAVAGLSDKKLTRKAHEFVILYLQQDVMNFLLMGDYYLEQAYRKKNNLSYDDPTPDFLSPIFEHEYYSFLKEFNANSPMSLYSYNYDSLIGSCGRLAVGLKSRITVNQPSTEIFDELIKSDTLTDGDLMVIETIKKDHWEGWSAKILTEFHQHAKNNYENLLATWELTGRNLQLCEKVIELCKSDENNVKQIIEYGYELVMRINNDKLFGNEEEFKISEFVYSEDADKLSDKPSPELIKAFEEFNKKYSDYIGSQIDTYKKDESLQPLITALGTDKGVLFDMITARKYYSSIVDYTPLNETQMNTISKIEHPFFYPYFTQKNNELIALLKSREGKKLENVYDTPEVEDDKVLYEIVKPYEGKVVFIDFWATWCGPCMSAMKQFEPTKKSFEGKDVVFIYLTDESSPMTLWENKIPEIDGKHYRLKDSQFSYIKKKYGSTGIPSYLILNKKGEQVYFRVGFEGSERLGQILNDELAK